MIDISEILAVMPHRYPFLLIDRVLEMEESKIRAVKNVTINEPVPVMPGVLIIEAMAQAGGFLLFSQVDDREDKLIYFTGIDKCRFRKPVVPGDQLIFEVELVSKRRAFAKIRGRALVDGEVVCEAEMLSALADR
jgi:beta-hydroxyacyl-ACP dehydratase FabZ